MTIFRNDAGEIRLVWRLILIVLLYVLAAVLLRLIPVVLYAAVLVSGGMVLRSALDQASSIILNNPVWNTAIGILSGLIGLLIVWFLIRKIEKSSFKWKSVGLDWKINSLLFILLGAVLAFILLAASLLTGNILGLNSTPLDGVMRGISIPILLQNLVLYLAMGLGEEVVFRGYVQTRLVERYKAVWGILIAAVIFVLLHQVSYNLSPNIILSGVMLWTAIGALYYLTRSLYFVIAFHGVMNALQNPLHLEIGDISSTIVNALALFLIIVFVLVRSRASAIRSNAV